VPQCSARLGLLGAFRVQTELAQVRVEVLHGLGRIFPRRLDRDFDELLAPLPGSLMTPDKCPLRRPLALCRSMP
jgi:hypothetical protein